jgi:hypothetical protein
VEKVVDKSVENVIVKFDGLWTTQPVDKPLWIICCG